MKKIIIFILLLLSLTGCKEDKKKNDEIKNQVTINKIDKTSLQMFLEDGNEIKNYIFLSGIEEKELLSKYLINVKYQDANEEEILTLRVECKDYNEEYNFCMNGSEIMQINGQNIIIYSGDYYNIGPNTKNDLRSYVRKIGDFILTYDGYDFVKLGKIKLYNLKGKELYSTNEDVAFAYIDVNDEINSVYPEINNDIMTFYTCDIANNKVIKYSFDIKNTNLKLLTTFEGYCNQEQSYFDFEVKE